MEVFLDTKTLFVLSVYMISMQISFILYTFFLLSTYYWEVFFKDALKQQKCLPLGKPAEDEMKLGSLKLKPNTKIMMMGTREESLVSDCSQGWRWRRNSGIWVANSLSLSWLGDILFFLKQV